MVRNNAQLNDILRDNVGKDIIGGASTSIMNYVVSWILFERKETVSFHFQILIKLQIRIFNDCIRKHSIRLSFG